MPGDARILDQKISPQDLHRIAADTFGDMIKIVVDIERERIAVGGTLHADAEELLIQEGSSQANIWGANYFPDQPPGSKLEYTALINIRSAGENTDQYIHSQTIRNKVMAIVEHWIGPI